MLHHDSFFNLCLKGILLHRAKCACLEAYIAMHISAASMSSRSDCLSLFSLLSLQELLLCILQFMWALWSIATFFASFKPDKWFLIAFRAPWTPSTLLDIFGATCLVLFQLDDSASFICHPTIVAYPMMSFYAYLSMKLANMGLFCFFLLDTIWPLKDLCFLYILIINFQYSLQNYVVFCVYFPEF